MRLSAEAKLREVATTELSYPAVAMPEAQQTVLAAAKVCEAAENLLEDIRRRHPGEDFKCPFVIALDEALASV